MEKFNILCTVSGGRTGYRSGLLKSNGIVVEFDSKDEADTEARKLRASVSPNATATFSYVVVEAL